MAIATPRSASLERKTRETTVGVTIGLEGAGQTAVATGIAFFDHMLTLFGAHGFFDLQIEAEGDLEVDFHHTVEDVGLVLGDALDRALGDRRGIRRYGHAVTPMDDALAAVTVDLSKRPFLVFNVPPLSVGSAGHFDTGLAREFFRALSVRGGMNLHINVSYGENDHHILEAVFKAAGRALGQAAGLEPRVTGTRSTKGVL